jgi:hypothetical protein
MIDKIVSLKKYLSLSLLASMLMAPLVSHAASLTTYRIYLDDTNRTESFIVFSSRSEPEQCSLDFKYFNFDDAGEMSLHKDAVLPINNAESWVRYSPRSFVLQTGRPQTIRFSMRRKPNSDAQEYRSYISISCEDVADNADAIKDQPTPKDGVSVSITPKLVQNVPLIIRTGPLDAQASFSDIVISGNKISAKILRSGKRSIFGRLALINRKTDEEIAFTDSISVYPETSNYAFEFSTVNKDNIPVEEMMLRFTEDENYGGSLNFEKNAK